MAAPSQKKPQLRLSEGLSGQGADDKGSSNKDAGNENGDRRSMRAKQRQRQRRAAKQSYCSPEGPIPEFLCQEIRWLYLGAVSKHGKAPECFRAGKGSLLRLASLAQTTLSTSLSNCGRRSRTVCEPAGHKREVAEWQHRHHARLLG